MWVETIRGLVRPFISVTLVCLTVFLGIMGKVEAKDIMEITAIIVAFHFGERSALRKPNGPPTNTQ